MKVAKSQRRKSGKTREHPEWSQNLEELEYRKQHYRSIAESTPDGMVTINAQGNIVLWNRAAEKIFGYTAEEMLGKPLTRIMPKRFHEAHKNSLNRVASGGKPRIIGKTVEVIGLRKGKSEFPLELSMAKWKTGEGVFFTAVIRDITERKRAEEALRQSEAKLKEAQISGRIGSWEFDIESQKITWSDNTYKLYDRDSALGPPTAEDEASYYSQEQGLKLREYARRAIEEGKDFKYDLEADLPSGRHVFYLATMQPIKDAYGRIVKLFGIVQDITERKQAEEALQQSQERYQNLVENINDVIFEVDTEGNITYISPAIERIGKYKADELIGQNFSRFVHPDDMPGLISSFHRVLAGILKPFEFRVLDKDGSIRYARTNSRQRMQHGQVIGITGVLSDITERKQAEEKLREGEERYHTLFDRSLDLVYLHDFEGNFIDANNAALNLLGYKKQEILSLNFASLLTQDQMPKVIQTLEELKKTGAQREVTEFRLKRKDGDFVDVETKASVIDRDGKPYAIQGIGRDITERKKMLDSLTITDRLAALGNMAGGFAHELNNPLTSVIGYVQLLLDRKDLSEDVRSDLTGIYEEAQRAAEVIKNFMVFALKRPLQKQLSDINSFIKDVLKLRQYEQKNTNIKVKTNFDPELPLVMVGPVRMHQVCLNIIINAEYFMFQAHKKGTLTITTESKGDVIRASFADDGPGIPPENLGQIFNPFFTTKEVGQGIGLGLSICHSIVTEHSGNIYVESEPGKGATFIVELPVIEGQPAN
ncbi:MAG: PAS domain S-box protein [Dehalococcoidia bacterium]